MSMMKRRITIGFLALAFAAAASAAYAGDPEVVAMHATFITKTNTKDQEPHLDIKIYNNQNVLIAENKDVAGSWSDNSIDSIVLDLKKDFKQSDISSGKVQLDIHPSGKEKWEFDYNISITYADNSVIWKRWDGKVLTQDKPTLSDSLSGE